MHRNVATEMSRDRNGSDRNVLYPKNMPCIAIKRHWMNVVCVRLPPDEWPDRMRGHPGAFKKTV